MNFKNDNFIYDATVLSSAHDYSDKKYKKMSSLSADTNVRSFLQDTKDIRE